MRYLGVASICLMFLSWRCHGGTAIENDGDAGEMGLTLRIYSYAPTNRNTLRVMTAETERVLKQSVLKLHWIDCSGPVDCDSGCRAPARGSDITVRIVVNAYPDAAPNALGMALRSPEGGESIALFYGRAVERQAHDFLWPQILGRTLAHELVHLLLPVPSHTHTGLMRREWSIHELRIAYSQAFALSRESMSMIRSAVRSRRAKMQD